MTTINDISDLIRIIRQDPDWAEALRSVLLSKELLALPETFAAFVSETRENSRLVNQRLHAIETSQASMGGDISRLTVRDYESYAARRAPLMAANLLNLLSVRTLSSTTETQWLDKPHTQSSTRRKYHTCRGPGTTSSRSRAGEHHLTNQHNSVHDPGTTGNEPRARGSKPRALPPSRDLDDHSRKRRDPGCQQGSHILQKATGTKTKPLLIGTALENGLDKGDTVFLEIPDLD